MDKKYNRVNLEKLPRTIEMRMVDNTPYVTFVDQTKLPSALKTKTTRSWQAVVEAVQTLVIRGAPALGVAGAAAVALWCAEAVHERSLKLDDGSFQCALHQACLSVAQARPTAVNLSWGVRSAEQFVKERIGQSQAKEEIAQALFVFVKDLEAADEATNRAIGRHGAELITSGSQLLTHCNAGSLATVFFGTALGIVYTAYSQGKVERVFADETRPVGQGARITVWELSRAGVPTTLICDSMAASLMATNHIDAVIVGADRIARNGDVANKIGTYGLAILAHEHHIPFYVAAPFSSIDSSMHSGASIPLEQRSPREVLPAPILGVDVWNPAFDVTPARYVSRIVTERGVFTPHELTQNLTC